MLRSSLRCEHTQDTRPAPDVQNGLPFEKVSIVDYCGTVRARAHLVLEHLLMNACIKIPSILV